MKEPLCLRVKSELSAKFRYLTEKTGAKIRNVFGISKDVIEYWIDCNEELENQITDYAFMTWIRNPVFQKYFQESETFQLIAEKYISEQLNQTPAH
jgi:glutamine amidotransferase PdxT